MAPATSDARGSGHGGGRAHSGAPRTIENRGPPVAGPARVRISRFSFSRRRGSRGNGSGYSPFGYYDVGLDYSASPPTVVVIPVIIGQPPAQTRAPAVITPSAAQDGVSIVRGDSKSYVTFPSSGPG